MGVVNKVSHTGEVSRIARTMSEQLCLSRAPALVSRCLTSRASSTPTTPVCTLEAQQSTTLVCAFDAQKSLCAFDAQHARAPNGLYVCSRIVAQSLCVCLVSVCVSKHLCACFSIHAHSCWTLRCTINNIITFLKLIGVGELVLDYIQFKGSYACGKGH